MGRTGRMCAICSGFGFGGYMLLPGELGCIWNGLGLFGTIWGYLAFFGI